MVAVSLASCSSKGHGEKEKTPSRDQVATNLICMEAVIEAARSHRKPDANDKLSDFNLLPQVQPKLAEVHQIRGQLSGIVDTWPDEFKRRSYKLVSGAAYWGNMFHSFAIEVMGPPPNFTARNKAPSLKHLMPNAFERRDEIRSLFQSCYRQLGNDRLRQLLTLWKQHQFSLKRVNEIRTAVAGYLRISGADDVPKFEVVYDPLMAPGTGANADPPTGTVLLIGPWLRREKAEMNLSHEFLHKPLLAIVAKPEVSEAIHQSACAFALVKNNYGYSTWQSYLLENLVRNISYRVPRQLDHGTDFVFESFFKTELPKYEAGNEPLGKFLVASLPRLKKQFCVD